MFNVILADDHSVVREGLKSLLSAMDDLAVVAEAADGNALIGLLANTSADLLILDLGMPGVAGMRTIDQVKSLTPHLKILVLTANVEARTVRSVMDAGADGYLTKDGDPEELEEAICAIREGRSYVSRKVRFTTPAPDRDGGPPDAQQIVSPVALTGRERQVLALVAQGLTTREAAARLGVSLPTARKHRENLMKKLNAHSVAELTAYAVRLGLPAG